MRASCVLWLLAASPVAGFGQTSSAFNFNPLNSTESGVHLSGVTVYSGYYSAGTPMGFDVPMQSPFLYQPTAMAGVAATIGGTKTGEKSNFSWSYSPSYFNMFYQNNEFSSNGSFNHSANAAWNRKLGNSNKWTLSTSVSGMIVSLEQLYATQGVLGSVASMPTTFDALASGMAAGKFTDTQLASMLTGAQVAATPEQGYLYGQRMLDVAANVGIGWAPSERTSISVNLAGTRTQPLNGAGELSGSSNAVAGAYLPQITNVSAAISWSYSLSPRTQIGIEGYANRTFSRLQEGYGPNGTFSLGRTLSRRWFAQVHGGAGRMTYTKKVFNAPETVQYLYGGNLGFKTYSQTYLISYDRTLGDIYGLGSGTTSTAMAAWTWRQPGSSWSVSASGGFQDLRNVTFPNTRSWRAGAGVARALGPHFYVSAQYVYLEFPGDLRAAGFDATQNGVIVSMTWSPSGYQ